ncbi:MAG TPA: VOC family protein [Rugosimonospora sp.]|nr:VOC family protein [Rugosimonospora sp.]
MSLLHAPLVYLFLETYALAEQRAFLESVAGLPVIEEETNPSHRHGVVKYDAGSLVVSLNLSPATRFTPSTSDGLATAFARGDTWRTDPHGHHYVLAAAPGAAAEVAELRLRVTDLDASVAFYRDVLGLRPLPGAAFATGTVPIVLRPGGTAEDGRRIRYDTYLLVFHTDDVDRTRTELTARGLVFTGRAVGSKEIGRTIRFTDPSGHRFCLYEPSEEVLTWPSGPTVRRILSGQLTRATT